MTNWKEKELDIHGYEGKLESERKNIKKGLSTKSTKTVQPFSLQAN